MADRRFAARLRRVFDRCAARGVTVVYEPGWASRTVGSKDLVAITSDLVHHTAGGSNSSDRGVVRDGRPGLRGPLSQLLTETTGTLRVIAAGYCNHAGSTLNRSYVGNSRTIGNEIVSRGRGTADFTPAQMRTARIVSEELAAEFGYESRWTRGHKEEGVPLGRKVDPAFSMTGFRASLGAAATTDSTTPTTSEEDELDANQATALARIDDLVQKLIERQGVQLDEDGKVKVAVGRVETAVTSIADGLVMFFGRFEKAMVAFARIDVNARRGGADAANAAATAEAVLAQVDTLPEESAKATRAELFRALAVDDEKETV